MNRLTEQQASELIEETLESLQRTGLVGPDIRFSSETELLGANSPLDSLAFVTFVADVEDRWNRLTGADVALVLEEIHEFNPNEAALTSGTLSRYIAAVQGM